MLILGIETSCDETSVALVRAGRVVLANLISSQTPIHAPFGGVVPELASRAHMQRLVPMVTQCLAEAGAGLGEVDAIAVTQGPGLVGALLVGVETAKGLALASGKPLVAVHHIAGHLYSVMLEEQDGAGDAAARGPRLEYPYLGLVVSGGHTSLVAVHGPLHAETIEETADDAAGEAFDKVAKILGLGYPGGPEIDRLAREGDGRRFALPRPMMSQGRRGFSFSGLKSAVARTVEGMSAEERADEAMVRDMCASFQEAVMDVLMAKTRGVLAERPEFGGLAIVGGVACNSRLREVAREQAGGVPVVIPAPVYCTDNAAMIAGLGWHLAQAGARADFSLNAEASLALP